MIDVYDIPVKVPDMSKKKSLMDSILRKKDKVDPLNSGQVKDAKYRIKNEYKIIANTPIEVVFPVLSKPFMLCIKCCRKDKSKFDESKVDHLAPTGI